jgi:hypothetical protein
VTVLAPSDGLSPFKSAAWGEVFDLMSTRLEWENLELTLQQFDPAAVLAGGTTRESFQEACKNCSVFIAVDIGPEAHELVRQECKHSRPVNLVFDSAEVRLALAVTAMRIILMSAVKTFHPSDQL